MHGTDDEEDEKPMPETEALPEEAIESEGEAMDDAAEYAELLREIAELKDEETTVDHVTAEDFKELFGE
jgi:hypothetical protein